MKKILSILLTQLILIQSLQIGFDDFVKIENLLEHAQYHQEQYGDTFFEFLMEHYADDDHPIVEHEEHKDLPFKKDANHLNQAPIMIAFQAVKYDLAQQSNQQKKGSFFYKEPVTESSHSIILQPPKA
ncbi:MAG: hypothetical protein CMB99_03795 [Flavobacteriaceae bacterium]|nr:hypothetical protein [Flavobacteriaceae bacterium]|tara:strand:+ start:93350 stop:93733 length:384 start_codon:yes stop_codon:yes gene_type:complete